MRKLLVPLVVLLAALPAAGSEIVRTLDQALPLQGATAVETQLSVGDLSLVGTDAGELRVLVEVRCPAGDGDCRDAAEKIHLRLARRGSWLSVEVEGFPKFRSHGLSTDLRLEVPRALRLEADLGVGDVEASGLTGDLEIDTGVGDVTVTLSASAVRSVELDTGVGDVQLIRNGERITGSGLVGEGLDWSQQKGASRVEVDSGVGDIEVILE